MTHIVWDPSAGHDVTPEQRPPAPASALADGSVPRRRLWAASEGPSRTEVGGAGGEPDGHRMPIRRDCWD